MKREQKPMTLLELSTELGIRCDAAQEVLERRGFSGYRPDAPLPGPVIDLLRAEFARSESFLDRVARSILNAWLSLSRNEGKLRRIALAVGVRGNEDETAARDGSTYGMEDLDRPSPAEGGRDRTPHEAHVALAPRRTAPPPGVVEDDGDTEWSADRDDPVETDERAEPEPAPVTEEPVSDDDQTRKLVDQLTEFLEREAPAEEALEEGTTDTGPVAAPEEHPGAEGEADTRAGDVGTEVTEETKASGSAVSRGSAGAAEREAPGGPGAQAGERPGGAAEAGTDDDEEPRPEETVELQRAIQRLLEGMPPYDEDSGPEAEIPAGDDMSSTALGEEERKEGPTVAEPTGVDAGGEPGADAVDTEAEQEEIDQVLDQLADLENILLRMSKADGGEVEDEPLSSEQGGEVKDRRGPERKSGRPTRPMVRDSVEGEGDNVAETGAGSEPLPEEDDGEEEQSRRALEESLAELEALLSELSSEQDSAAEPGAEEEDRPEPEAPRPDRTSESDIHALLRDEGFLEKSGVEGGARESHSADEDLFDLSVLLERVESAENEPEVEAIRPPAPPVEPPIETKEGPAPKPQRRSVVRKWFRRSVGPRVTASFGGFRGLFRGLSPLQRTVLGGGALVLVLVLGGGLAYDLYTHRAGGEIELWERGQRFLADERPDLARKEFARLVSRYPESPYLRRALYLLGECRYREGAYAEALGTFLKVKNLLAARPMEIDGLMYPDFTFRGQGELRIADCYVKTGRFEDGVACYDRIIERDRYSPAAHNAALAKAEAYLDWGEREGSPSAFRRAVQSFVVYRQDFPLATRQSFVHWRTAHAYLGLARTDRENARDHCVSAVVELEEARRREDEFKDWSASDRSGLLLDLANTYAELSEWPYATAEYEQVIGMAPAEKQVLDAKLGLAACLLESGDYERAFRVSGETAEAARDPGDRAVALFRAGEAAYELHRYEEMLDAYEQALSLNADDRFPQGLAERAHMRITNVLFTQEKNYAEAADRYRRIVSRYPEGPYTHLALYRLGASLFELGKYEEAAEAFRRSIRNYPQFEHRDPELRVDAYYKVAECWMRLESWPDAVEALKAALQDLSFPDDERGLRARLDLASCYASMSLYDKAIPVLENYLSKFPRKNPDGGVSMRLGEYYRARLDFTAARETHERVAREHAGTPVAAEARFAEAQDLLAESEAAPEEEREVLRSAALLRFERVIQLRPEDPRPYLEIARVYHGQRDFSAARIYLGRYFEMVKDGPEFAYARFLAGDAAYSEEDYPAAIAHFESLPGSSLAEAEIAQASFEHADACRRTGEIEKASILFAETARLFPSTDWGEQARWQLDNLAWKQRVDKIPVN